MGRWKGSPQGPYYDANDTGPDQVAPPPGMGQNGQPLPQQAPTPAQQAPWWQNIPDAGPGGMTGQMPQQPGGMDPNALPGTYHPWSESMPDGMGGSYNPGGHVDANGNPLPGPPPMDTSGWARKQYPGGIGGPLTPMAGGSIGSLGSMIGQVPKGPYEMQTPKSGFSLSSLGNTLGSAGGNVLKKLF